MKPRVFIESAGCAIAALGGSLLYGEFFATGGYLPPLAIASVAGAAVATVAAARRWSAARTSLVALAGFVLLAIYGVFGRTIEFGLPSWATTTELFWGVAGGWARMLTIGLPADVRGDLLLTPVLLAWLAAFLGATLAARTGSVLAPIGPPLLAFVIALLFIGDRPGVQFLATAVFLAGVAVLMLSRSQHVAAGSSRKATKSVLAFSVPAVVVIGLLGIAAGQILPLASGQDRFDPRSLHPAPVWIADTLSPLAKLKGQLREQPARGLFTVDTDAQVDRIMTAALDQYDGVLWRATDNFVVASHHLAADETLTRTRQVSAQIGIDGLAGPFLPVVGRLVTLSKQDSVEVGFSAGSGMLATPEESPQGLRYTVTGQVSVRDDGLPLALPSASPAFLRYTELPDSLPPQWRSLARELTQREQTPYGKLVAIERHLKDLPYSLNVEPGHSIGALTRLLTDGGYAEQCAAAFTVLARAAGFPARVAVGYRLRSDRTVTTADAHAWAEVSFDGYGWVPFEPTSTTKAPATPPSRSNSPVVGPLQANPPPGAPHVVGPLPGTAGEPGSGWGGVLRTTAFAAIGLVSLSALTVLATTAEKLRRRWWRRRNGVLGAWREATDRLVERGISVPISATAEEVAELAHAVLGQLVEPMADMARLASKAVFAPEIVTDEDVTRAWALEARFRRGLAKPFSLRWVRAGLDFRPLLAGWREARQSRRSLRRLGVGR
ncbi:transglutaminase TgpA family protein [Kibdelosporangium aridum]|uniref:transglutaminase TgpA family protein n=1 Tax=Kibdelosporangium aridum TaxID=2030 RepID=UPI00052679AF